jgi:hypothetical protein
VRFWAGGGTESEPADKIQLRLLVYVLDYDDGKLLSWIRSRNNNTNLQSSMRLLNHSSSSAISPSSLDRSFAWKATSIVMFWPSCAPNIAPTTGPFCCRNVCRVTQSVMVRSTSGWSCTVGLASEARAVETSGFPEVTAMFAASYESLGVVIIGLERGAILAVV